MAATAMASNGTMITRNAYVISYNYAAGDGDKRTTEGNATDFNFIAADILQLHSMFTIVRSAYDRTFAGEMVQRIGKM